MKRIRSLRILMIICIIGLMLTACGAKEPDLETFEGSVIEKSFPVPQEATSSDRTTANMAMDYVRYSLPGLNEEEGVPEAYLDAIEAWGWDEKKNDDTDKSRVFQKEELIVHLTVHDGYFIVMIPKETKEAIKGLKTK